MEGGRDLRRGWFMRGLFQVKIYASKIADTKGEKKNSLHRGSLNTLSVSISTGDRGLLCVAPRIANNR